jgi:hypothetical protein
MAVPDYNTCEKSDETNEIEYGSYNDERIVDTWLTNDTKSSMQTKADGSTGQNLSC